MKTHSIESPITMTRSIAKHKFSAMVANKNKMNTQINLNILSNLHHKARSNVKRNYTEWMEQRIKQLPALEGRLRLTYTLYPKTRRLCDVSNICSMVDKFFCDALQEHGVLEDDNYLHIPEINYRFGRIDKFKPRVDILIEELDED